MHSKFIATILFFVTMPSAHAINCFRASPVEDYRNLIHKVAIVDEAGRKTEEEYAAAKGQPLNAVQNRFAATGELKCGTMTLSAQLTGANNVITTAGHAFFNTKNCQRRSEPESCTFKVKIGSSERIAKVSSMAGIGIKCPKLPDLYDDWAVLKIDPPLSGLNPYQLPDSTEVSEGQKVISVAAQNHDFTRRDPRTGKKIMPKSIDECEIKKVDRWNGPILFESNCDTGRGASGGSVLRVVRGDDVLVGINSANDENDALIEKSERRGRPNSGPYKSNQWAIYEVPLAGDFLRTVEQAMGGRSL